MKKILTLTLLALTITLAACSKEESVTEKVDRINTENAASAVKAIKSPIDKARATQNQGEERTEGIDKTMENLNK